MTRIHEGSIKSVPLEDIDNNPHRHLKKYPYVEAKVESLMRSFKDVGMWDGVLGRKVGNRVQIAFGHHRLEAARRLNLKNVGVIIYKLDDGEMLKFMGRENGEDYNSDFMVMLETWEAAVEYLAANGRQKPEALEVARLLGWTVKRSGRSTDEMNKTAEACANTAKLLVEELITRDVLIAGKDEVPLAVRTVRDVTQRMVSRVNQFERVAKGSTISPAKVQAAKVAVGKSGTVALRGVKAGTMLAKNAVSIADVGIATARAVTREPAFMDVQLDGLAAQISRMLNEDNAGQKLDELAKLMPTNYDRMNSAEKEALGHVSLALEYLEDRTKKHISKLNPKTNVTALKVINKQES